MEQGTTLLPKCDNGRMERQRDVAETGAASALRRRLAAELVSACPIELATEAALTGSAARGVADEYSDIELNFWSEALPSSEQRCVDGAKAIVQANLNRSGPSEKKP